MPPETNGEVALKAWAALGEKTGRDHTHLAQSREGEKIRFRDLQAQPRKIISSPTWSGIESEHVSYTASYTNIHELIPWRTLTGRQHFYQDHRWLRDFGEGFAVYRPPIDTRTIAGVLGKHRARRPPRASCRPSRRDPCPAGRDAFRGNGAGNIRAPCRTSRTGSSAI
jgi:nitrate reductase / nitrite oxidoreductase, alpha subunit